MADSLYLSLWFPSFTAPEMMPRALSVMHQFPFSSVRPGIGYVAVHPLSWDEAPIFAQTFDFRADPERVTQLAAEFLHDDYAYEFEALWDLWAPQPEREDWQLSPQSVRIVVHGLRFDDGIYQQQGHIMLDLGLDLPFLQEEIELTPDIADRIRLNVQKLVGFTNAVEKNCGITGRVLWSESEENLAQKLIARLQKVH
jgi:hypothetical protein